MDAVDRGGYAGLTMRGVARSIGASLATVQRHFGTKDELWSGVVDEIFDSIDQPGVLLANSSRPLVDGIYQLLGVGRSHPGFFSTMMADRTAGHEARFAQVADRLAERHDVAFGIIAERQHAGTMRHVDGRALLLLLNVGIGAISASTQATREIYGFDLDSDEDRQRLAVALADIIVGGL